MRRAGLLMGCLLLAGGCTAPELPGEGWKAVYVETPGAQQHLDMQAYPLDPRDEERVYSAVRSFATDTRESREKFGRLLDQWPPRVDAGSEDLAPSEDSDSEPEIRDPKSDSDSESEPESESDSESEPDIRDPKSETDSESEPDIRDPKSETDSEFESMAAAPFPPDEFELDLSAYPERAPPALLLVPEQTEIRADGACYLGHAAYRRNLYSPGGEVVQHLRLLLVNRRALPVRLRARDVRVQVPPPGSESESDDVIAASDLQLLASADEAGRAAPDILVRPGEQRLMHLFFLGRRLPPVLRCAWMVEAVPDEEAPSRGVRWRFAVTLLRRYAIPEGIITPLERRVARGDRLPERPVEGVGEVPEPRVSPVGG